MPTPSGAPGGSRRYGRDAARPAASARKFCSICCPLQNTDPALTTGVDAGESTSSDDTRHSSSHRSGRDAARPAASARKFCSICCPLQNTDPALTTGVDAGESTPSDDMRHSSSRRSGREGGRFSAPAGKFRMLSSSPEY
jgi:hypothetical protein